MKAFTLALAVMGICIAVAMADDPTAGQSAIDVHYLDHDFKSYQYTTGVVPGMLIIVAVLGLGFLFVASTHKTGVKNGQGGLMLNLESAVFIFLLLATMGKIVGMF